MLLQLLFSNYVSHVTEKSIAIIVIVIIIVGIIKFIINIIIITIFITLLRDMGLIFVRFHFSSLNLVLNVN